MNRGVAYILLIFVCGVVCSSCSNTRHLPEGESLFLGARVNIKDTHTTKKERKLQEGDLEDAVQPTPNRKILGMRLRLTMYNLTGEPKKEKGLKNWLRNKLGEPPVLTSQFNMGTSKQLLVHILENRGYFYPEVNGTVKTRRKKTKADFDVLTGPQYKIRNVEYVKVDSYLTKHVSGLQATSLLSTGVPYNLDLIKGERERIDRQLKEIGYYYFRPDYLLVRADTTVGQNQVDVYMMVKNDIPEEARSQYYIKDVFIFPDFNQSNRRRNSAKDTTSKRIADVNKKGKRRNSDKDTVTKSVTDSIATQDTIFYERYYIVGKTKKYEPFVFTQAMQFSPGEAYNRTDQNASLNRLINMGTFKFVKNDFQPAGPYQLNAFYYLTSYPKKSMRAELSGLTKNDSRVGSQLSLSWRNRNTMKGAELLVIKGSAGFETQFGGGVKRPNTYQFGIEPSLTFPRFVIPFIHPSSSSLFVPRTIVRVGYDLMLRQGLYRLHSLKAGYGYTWKEDIRKEHQLFPINITYVRTDTLNRDSAIKVNYSNLVFNGIIIGPTYQYTFNSRGSGAPHHSDVYFDGLVDLSANILGLAQGANINKTPNDGVKHLLGTPYAQYVKLQTDLRYYINYTPNQNSIWATRLLIGFGMPYGNSSTMPNVKQFFSGGNSSLRGFPSRLVGPGTFFYKQDPAKTFIETAGDIKLEASTELRAQLINFLHGAVFVDAGNIWMYRQNPLFPNGEFNISRFYKELAVDVGAGLRFDFKILVLRLDLAFPVRKPWLPEGDRWVAGNLRFGDPVWRKENLILNLGIGYPF